MGIVVHLPRLHSVRSVYNIRPVLKSSANEPNVEKMQPVVINDPVDSRSVIQARLIALREYAGLTQADFGATVGCSPGRWSNYENGHRPLPPEIASKVCLTYGVTMDWLYRGNSYGLPKEMSAKLAATLERKRA